MGLLIGGICLLMFTKSDYMGFGLEMNSYKCTPKGCIKSKGGEFYDENNCKKSCKSWVKENDECQLVEGSRWNGYSLKSTCEKN
jgi:hypothetical protein